LLIGGSVLESLCCGAQGDFLTGRYDRGGYGQQLIDPADFLTQRSIFLLQDKDTRLRLLIGSSGVRGQQKRQVVSPGNGGRVSPCLTPSLSLAQVYWPLGISVQKRGGKEEELIGMVSTRVNAQFSLSSCLKLLASQMGREDKAALSRAYFLNGYPK